LAALARTRSWGALVLVLRRVVALPLLAALGLQRSSSARAQTLLHVARMQLLAALARLRSWAAQEQALLYVAVGRLLAALIPQQRWGVQAEVSLRVVVLAAVRLLAAAAGLQAQTGIEARALSSDAAVSRRVSSAAMQPRIVSVLELAARLPWARPKVGRDLRTVAQELAPQTARPVEMRQEQHAWKVAAPRLARAVKPDREALKLVAATPSAGGCYVESHRAQLRSRSVKARAERSKARTPRGQTPRCARNPHPAPQSSPAASARNAAPRVRASRDNESSRWPRAS
jgi:hypothetical protein